MNLVLVESRAVITPNDLRAQYPNVSFPPDGELCDETLADYGAAVLTDDPHPELGMLETLEPGKVRKKTGKWYRAWTVIAADPESVAKATSAQFEQAIQSHLNDVAVAAGYDSISTVVSYAEEPAVPKFQNDGKAFRAWRSRVWGYAYEQLAAVKSGEREQPKIEDFLQELPALELPE